MKRKEYQRPSILLVEVRVLDPIANSKVDVLQAYLWEQNLEAERLNNSL